MAKKENEYGEVPAEDKPVWPSGSLTIDLVQRMIDAAFIRYDQLHGHLSPDDGARMLDALKKT